MQATVWLSRLTRQVATSLPLQTCHAADEPCSFISTDSIHTANPLSHHRPKLNTCEHEHSKMGL